MVVFESESKVFGFRTKETVPHRFIVLRIIRNGDLVPDSSSYLLSLDYAFALSNSQKPNDNSHAVSFLHWIIYLVKSSITAFPVLLTDVEKQETSDRFVVSRR